MRRILICLGIFSISVLRSFAQDKPTFYLRGLLEMWRKNASTTAKRVVAYNKLIPVNLQQNVVYSLNVSSAWYYTKNVSNYTSFNNDNYLDLSTPS